MMACHQSVTFFGKAMGSTENELCVPCWPRAGNAHEWIRLTKVNVIVHPEAWGSFVVGDPWPEPHPGVSPAACDCHPLFLPLRGAEERYRDSKSTRLSHLSKLSLSGQLFCLQMCQHGIGVPGARGRCEPRVQGPGGLGS